MKITKSLFKNKALIIIAIVLGLFLVFKRKKITPEDVPESETIFESQSSEYTRPYGAYVQMTVNLFDAIDGLGTDVEVIEDIFTSINPTELQLINQLYNTAYDETLATALRGDLGVGNSELITIVELLFSQANIEY